MLLLSTITINLIFLERRIKCQLSLIIHWKLARKLLSKYCAKIIEHLKNILLSEDFLIKHRQSPKDFTRQRKLPFHLLVCFLINFVKGSYQNELDKFFQAINQSEIAKRFVSKVALCKARMKLKFETFIDLNHHLIECFEKIFSPNTWYGFRLLAVDGTTIQLPRIKEIIEHFGVWNVRKGDPRPMARASQLFDTLNKITINAIISPKSVDERDHASQLFLNLMPNDLILLDRGYPAFWLFKIIMAMSANFCARISTRWNIVKEFIQSGQKERIIQLNASYSSISICRQMGLDIKPLALRLIRIELDSGEVEVLITSLIDTKSYPYDIFAELYHKRWPVEEDYKVIKRRLDIENFSGKTVLSVYQDFHANIFSKNLTTVLTFPVSSELKEIGKKKKYEHQVNFSNALAKTKNIIALLFQRTKVGVLRLIKELHQIFLITTEPIRPGRKYPRKHKVLKRSFHHGYKPIF